MRFGGGDMISFFPEIYPDELVYSQLSRFYQKSGYLAYIFAANELFENPLERPNIEFLNGYTPSTLALITKNIPIENLVLEHTMFPYYGRFLLYERRKKAFAALCELDRNYYNLVALPKSKDGNKRYLRYCPLCSKEDKDRYGETYWHREHQIIGINICPLHKCYLYSSEVEISSKTSPILKTAEEAAENEKVVFCNSEIEIKIAEYVSSVFQSDIDFDSMTTPGKFLHSKMIGTPYLSIRGKRRNMELFNKDFLLYYEKVSNNWFSELWQMQKTMTDNRQNFFEICLMAMFLNVTPDELVLMELPEKPPEIIYDEKIKQLHKEGFNYMQISKLIGGGYDTVKAIGEGRYDKYHITPKTALKSGAKPIEWDKMDTELLPQVKSAIKEMNGDGTKRPIKITLSSVGKYLNFPEKRLYNLTKCKAEILRHFESQAEFWAREMLWSFNMTVRNGQNVTRTTLCKNINIRKKDFTVCLPFLRNYIDENIAAKIESL